MIKPLALRARGLSLSKSLTKIARRLRGSLGVSVGLSTSPCLPRRPRVPLDVPVPPSASPCAPRRLRASLDIDVSVPPSTFSSFSKALYIAWHSLVAPTAFSLCLTKCYMVVE